MANLKKTKVNNSLLDVYETLCNEVSCTFSNREELTSGVEFNAGYKYKEKLTFETPISLSKISNPCILEIFIYALGFMGTTYISLSTGMLNYYVTANYSYIKGNWSLGDMMTYNDVIFKSVFEIELGVGSKLSGFEIFSQQSVSLSRGYSNFKCRLRTKRIK